MDSNQPFLAKTSELGDNAFPKISGKRKDFLSGLQDLAEAGKLPSELELEGTVKLHGMHADIVFDLGGFSDTTNSSQPGRKTMNDDTTAINAVLSLSGNLPQSPTPNLKVTFQSRNRVCDPESSTHGWPKNIASFPDALIYLRDRILGRYHEKNPDKPLNTAWPLIVAGEWIGPKVQQDVGVSKLSPRFVILTIQINGLWQHDLDYANIEAEKASIYSIFRAGHQTLKFDTTDLTDTNPTLLEMQKLADEVEKSCPFAAAFGLQNRPGEGIVWKPGCSSGRANPKYWFKTKGPISGPENRIDAASIARDAEKNSSIKEMCARFVTPRRIEQGFEYLLEMGLEPDRTSVKVFVEWIMKDVTTEERGEIEDLETMFKGSKAALVKRVKWLARDAFIEQMELSGASIA